MATVNTSIKIDEETKKEAQKLFKDLGLSLSAAINIFLKQAIREKGIPFYVNSLPENSELAQAFEEAKQIKENPSSRRLIVSSWNPAEVDTMALPPCHSLFQFYVSDGKLSCQLYQRSGDVFLGVPFNIASYSLLTILIAKECNLGVGEFVHTLGDAHIYNNHFDQVNEQISRTPYDLPSLKINEFQSIFDLKISDVELVNYESHPFIKAPIAV